MVQVKSKLLQASSLHPKISTTIQLDNDSQQPQPDCHLDLVYVLPPSVFVDPYQLKDLEPIIGRAIVFGEHDLELPLEKIKETRGSVVFLRQQQASSREEIELPLHLRYQQPSSKQDKQLIQIQAPYAGWTCGPSSQWPPISNALVPRQFDQDRIQFTPFTNDSTTLTLYVPIGKIQDVKIVSIGTFVTVILCTVWIICSIVLSLKKRKRTEAKGKRRKSE